MHFKLLNALCKQQALDDREKARSLHNDLLMSGMDRILVVCLFLLFIFYILHSTFFRSSPSSLQSSSCSFHLQWWIGIWADDRQCEKPRQHIIQHYISSWLVMSIYSRASRQMENYLTWSIDWLVHHQRIWGGSTLLDFCELFNDTTFPSPSPSELEDCVSMDNHNIPSHRSHDFLYTHLTTHVHGIRNDTSSFRQIYYLVSGSLQISFWVRHEGRCCICMYICFMFDWSWLQLTDTDCLTV